MQFPQVRKLLFQSTNEIRGLENREIENNGRIGLICEAISLLKKDIGDEAVISGLIPGPYTLMIYICKAQNLFGEMKKEPQMVLDALFRLSSFLSDIGNAYLEAGADFITVHEMGGSPGFIGPGRFEQFVLPSLQELHQTLKGRRVLSACGKTDAAMHLLTQTGADAISLDQMADLHLARSVLKDTLLFGNVDPVNALWWGDEGQVAEAVQRSKEAGVDAVWPGCDLVPQTPLKNISALWRSSSKR
jgi:[methyl-Co(III) methanol-specific corrinoid protein]:coenzyme M methyltransferase